MRADEPFLVRHADLVFALKTFAASMLALVIALAMDLPRPYWAMATVYITSQPLAGATSSKAFFRVMGTLAGAAMTVALVPNLIDAPELLCLAIALWVGLCLYLSLLDGTPRSYVFMLAGYTVALIGFPSVSEPGAIFDTAVARLEEISLGIICASLVSTIVFPRSVAPAVAHRVDAWLADARRLSQVVLLREGTSETHRAKRLKLATDIVEIDTLSTHLAYDRLTDRNAVTGLGEIRLRMLTLLPVIASLEDRLAALGEEALRRQPGLKRLLEDLAQWIASDVGARQPAERIRAAISGQQAVLDDGADWERIITTSLLLRLRELVDLSRDCRALTEAIAESRNVATIDLAFHSEAGAAPVRHRDRGLALWSAAGAVVAILICCAFWIGTGWPDGASAPMMAAVACSFFAAQDEPARFIRSFGRWSLVAIVVVAVYLFAVVPAISHIEVLVVALAPTFLLYGFLIGRPATAGTGTALAANTATLLAIQSTYSADFASYANSAVAFFVGIVVAEIVTRIARGVGAEWIANRLVLSNWKSIAVAAERRGKRDRAEFAGLMLHRLGLLVQRIAFLSESDRRDTDSLVQLRIGINIIDLRRARYGLAASTIAVIDDMLDRLAVACRGYAGDGMPAELLTSVDRALAQAVKDPNDSAREDALIGLVGIRRGLFPDAPAYRPRAESVAA
ncbi:MULTISPECIES: FUSC family protein [Bradyrhizobium]|uniref:Blr3852 protein n=2 Tax=Bradyrhizobium diazoefficiens TaxID=1355477 RepID=Q89NI6_BRADU|nr:FUSC family protein [Bradyrhizobium diazoefficiens]MBP1066188.1 putative membrane protein YccC [Bradyrhizobium japonicum]AND89172.1 fusaric acid transporter [Bradyrhizobium diazoefficiens USDA 110]AWO90791.1 FUSC family protein [Bradyrhizobium diazoefficiens]PDT60393.1 FUSC family protein [Bradyrhizobium diazoefficiens]QBP22626.1 FUSC family protein [Bradyrhizobium diazoefficiens]